MRINGSYQSTALDELLRVYLKDLNSFIAIISAVQSSLGILENIDCISHLRLKSLCEKLKTAEAALEVLNTSLKGLSNIVTPTPIAIVAADMIPTTGTTLGEGRTANKAFDICCKANIEFRRYEMTLESFCEELFKRSFSRQKLTLGRWKPK